MSAKPTVRLLTAAILAMGVAPGCDSDPGDADSGGCEDVSCGENAHCDEVTLACVCDNRFEGDPVAGCEPLPSCDETTCNGHGACDGSSGTLVCTCDPGYQRDRCEACAPDYNLTVGVCVNNQVVPCTDIAPPASAHQVEDLVEITYSDAGGWTTPANCAWACDTDYDLVAGACIGSQMVPCADIAPPANARQVDGLAEITYTDAGGWTTPADCAWVCDADYDLVVGACVDSQMVPCTDIAPPASAYQVEELVEITYSDAGGWTTPANCAWACDTDYDLVAGACIGSQMVPCTDIAPPANARQVDGLAEVTYTDAGGWTTPAKCAWACDTDYDLVVGTCIDSQMVACTDVAPPAHAYQVDGLVEITYADAGGWTTPADCAWACNAGYDVVIGLCRGVFDVGVGTSTAFDLSAGNLNGLADDGSGGLALELSTFEISFIWIANSAENTFSKLDTKTGCELARYSVCNNPSRTAVDNLGNGIVTCRGDGRVAKVAVFEQDCIDLNGNGVIDTSRDNDSNCVIDPSEMAGNDECVLWTVQPDGAGSGCSSSGNGCARGVGVDDQNNIWVGFWNSRRIWRLNGADGATMATWNVTGRPFGIAIDSNRNIWIASRDPQILMKVDPNLGELNNWSLPNGDSYGIAIDPFGNIWCANGTWGGVHRFNPITETFDVGWDGFGNGYSRGIAISVMRDAVGNIIESKVYVAHHTWNGCVANGQHRYVDVIDALTLTVEAPIDLGSDVAPVGIAIDDQNNLWTVNQCDNSATRVDTSTKQVIGTYPVGLGPDTYSDMTGSAIRTITSNGYYRHVFTGFPGADTVWDQLDVDATLPGDGITNMSLRYRTADTSIDLTTTPWQGPHGPYPPGTLPLDLLGATGDFLEVEVTLVTSDPALIPTLNAITVLADEP